MELFDIFKDTISLAKKANNLPLLEKIYDLEEKMFDLQQENQTLKDNIKELQKEKNTENDIVRHKDSYLTLKQDKQQIKYCTHCWDKEKKLIQLLDDSAAGKFHCPQCKVSWSINIEDIKQHVSY